LRIRGLGRLRQVWNLARVPVRRRALILYYHRIADHATDPFLHCVRPAFFREHLHVLRQSYRVVRLNELVNSAEQGDITGPVVAVTFDDGYADNLWNAVPILEEFEVPATFFVTSGWVGMEGEALPDVVERCLLTKPEIPTTLELDINGQHYSWHVGPLTSQDAGWNVRMSAQSSRQRCVMELRRAIHRLPAVQRAAVLKQLMEWAGIPKTARPERRMLNVCELQALAEHPLITIGAHTEAHVSLPHLPVEEQEREIRGSRETLQKLTGSPVEFFAYPYGNYGSATIECVRRTGFRAAFTTRPEVVMPHAYPFTLPRRAGQNVGADVFGPWLRRAFLT